MKVHGKNYTSIWIEDDNKIFIIDQRWLPHEFKIVELKSVNDFATAIKDMWVRGAPLIGVTAAFAFAKAMLKNNSNEFLDETKAILMSTRPTAVNLYWAVETMFNFLLAKPLETRVNDSFKKANDIFNKDILSNHMIGKHGYKIIKSISEKKKI